MSAAALLKCVGIERVLFVDDAFGTLTSDGAFDLLLSLEADEIAGILGVTPEAAAGDRDLLRAEVDERWADDQRADELAEAIRSTAAAGARAAAVQERFAPVEVAELGLAEWQSKKEQLVAESATEPTLVLFDRDFQAEGRDAKTGDRLLAELEEEAEALDPGRLWCGLLTQAANEANEEQVRTEIVAEKGVSPNRLVVIAKDALGDEDRFVGRLRTMLLAPLLSELMDVVSAKTVDTHKAAKEETAGLSAEQLEAVVFRSSRVEGVWEPDTLVRIFTLLQREKARRAIREEERVHVLTAQIRCLGDSLPEQESAAEATEAGEADNAEARELSGAWQLQRREIYDPADETNELHLPLELGDLFERTGNRRRYVLVVQSCHLMVRENGSRTPELSHLLLVEIGAGSGDSRYDAFELPYFDEETGASSHARLNRPAFARSQVLDFCVLNDDGASRLRSDSEPSTRLLPTWRERHRRLLNLAVAAGKRDEAVLSVPAGSATKNVIEATRRNSAGGWKEDPFPVDLTSMPGELAYDCRRIGRLCEPYASALLTRLHDYLARDAYLHDLGSG